MAGIRTFAKHVLPLWLDQVAAGGSPHNVTASATASQVRADVHRSAGIAAAAGVASRSATFDDVTVLASSQIADLVRLSHGTARMADQMQIRQFCLRQHDRHRGIADVRTSTWVGIQSASKVAH